MSPSVEITSHEPLSSAERFLSVSFKRVRTCSRRPAAAGVLAGSAATGWGHRSRAWVRLARSGAARSRGFGGVAAGSRRELSRRHGYRNARAWVPLWPEQRAADCSRPALAEATIAVGAFGCFARLRYEVDEREFQRQRTTRCSSVVAPVDAAEHLEGTQDLVAGEVDGFCLDFGGHLRRELEGFGGAGLGEEQAAQVLHDLLGELLDVERRRLAPWR